MGVYTNNNSSFPSQVVSDSVKMSEEYGLQVSNAIEQEWFDGGRVNGNRYLSNWNNFHQLRLYARGEQSVQKYKDELAINGDLSYLNIDWKPVPIVPKFVDIVVNGISEKQYDINSSSISYFDSETDFGVYTFDSYNNRFVKKVLYENIKFTLLIIDGPSKVKIERDQDEKTTELIQTYITQKNYPKAIASYKQLNTPNKDLIDKINQLEDEKQQEIISLFKNKSEALAYEKYQLLYLSTNEIDKLVLDYLNVKNKTKVVSMTSERVFKLLKNAPISNLKLLSEGNYRVYLDKNGECTIFSNSKEVFNFKVDVYTYCSKITESKFDFYVNSESNINLSLKSKLLKVVDVTSTKVFKAERNPTVNYIENPDIPKNKYWKMEVINSTLLIGDKEIISYESMKFVSKHKLKGQHSERNAAIILVAVLSYPVYWLVQYYKVASSELNTLENL
jgi:hypothetical protein